MNTWTNFNNFLVRDIQNEWEGPFAAKSLDFDFSFNDKKAGLEDSVLAMFKDSSKDVVRPTVSGLHEFGSGNIGKDTEVLMFLENEISENLRAIVGGEESVEGFKDSVLNEVTNINELPKEVFQYKVIKDALVNFALWNSAGKKEMNPEHVGFEVSHQDDLAFLKCCSLIECLLMQKSKPLTKNWFYQEKNVETNYDFFDCNFYFYKKWVKPSSNEFLRGINKTIEEADKELSRANYTMERIFNPTMHNLEDISNQVYKEKKVYPPLLNDVYLTPYANNQQGSLKLKEKIPFNTIFPDILSSSSFLWADGVFGLDPMDIGAMSTSQKEELLIKNKSLIIENCFNELGEILEIPQDWKQKTTPIKNAILANSQKIESLLYKKNVFQEKYEPEFKESEFLKNQFLSIANKFDIDDVQASTDLLMFAATSPLDIPPQKLQLDHMVVEIIKRFQTSVLESSKTKEDILSVDQTIKIYANTLEKSFNLLMGEVQNLTTYSKQKKTRLLKVYTTFSFFVLNKDLFPDFKFSEKLSKQKAVEKSSNIFKRFMQKKAFRALRGGEKALPVEGQYNDDIIEQIINKRLSTIYRDYRTPSKPFKLRELSKNEINAISIVAKSLQDTERLGDKRLKENFFKLEGILENLLLKDNAFIASLKNENKRINVNSAAALEAHTEACLMFALESDRAKNYTMPATQGFRKLYESIVQATSDKGLKNSIVNSNLNLLKQASQMGVEFSRENIENIIENDFNKINQNQLQQFRVELTQQQTKEEMFLKKASSHLKRAIESSNLHKNLIRPPNERVGLEHLKSRAIEDFNRELRKRDFKQEELKGLIKFNFANLTGEQERTIMNSLEEPSLKSVSDKFSTFIHRTFPSMPFRALEETLSEPYQEEIAAPLFDRNIMLAIWLYENINKKIDGLEIQSQKYVVVRAEDDPLNENRTIDVFSNQNLFQFYGRQNGISQKDQALAENAYWEFLPIFISSFVTTNDILGSQERGFEDTKFQFIKNLPGAKTVYQEFVEWKEKNALTLRKIEEWAQAETQKNEQAMQVNKEKASDIVSSMFHEGKAIFNQAQFAIGSKIAEAKDYMFLTSAIAGISLITLSKMGILAGVGILGSFGVVAGVTMLSFAGSYLVKKVGIPYATKMINTLIENFEYYTGADKYKDSSPTDYLLELLDTLLTNELSMFDKFEETQHKMSFSFYIQEMFEVLEGTGQNINTFRQRINSLIPNTERSGNFSVLALNMFNFLNKDAFLIVPQEIMRNSSHPLFQSAVKDYLFAYKQTLMQLGQGFKGRREFIHDNETPYSRFIKNNVDEKGLVITFDANSAVGKILNNKQVSFNLNSSQVYPFQEIQPSLIASNLVKLINKSKEVLEHRFVYEQKMKIVLIQSQGQFSQKLNEQNQLQANGLVATFEMLRYGFSLAKAYEDLKAGVETPYSKWLVATNEASNSVLNSELFMQSMSVMMKTAEFANALGLADGTMMLKTLKELRATVNNASKTQILVLPPSSVWNDLKNATINLLKQLEQYPSIAYPLLIEYEQNKGFLTPVIVWNKIKSDLFNTYGENYVNIINQTTQSKVLYLTNTDIDPFFENAAMRGNAFSFSMVNVLQDSSKRFVNSEISRFLGRVSQQELDQSLVAAPSRYRLPFMRPQNRRQIAAEQVGQEVARPNAGRVEPSQSYFPQQQASTMINPQIGLSPSQYDPMNLGVSPQNALAVYGNNLALPSSRMPYGADKQISQYLGAHNEGQQMLAQQQRAIQQQPMQQEPPKLSSLEDQNFMFQQPIEEEVVPQALLNQPEEQMQQIPQQVQQEVEPVQQEVAPVQNQMMIGVGAQGQSIGLGSSSQQQDDPGRRLLESQQEASREVALRAQEPSFPQQPAEPFRNPAQQEYDPIVPQQDGFDWQNAAMIGGGAALGAGLLGMMLGGKKKDKKRR